MMRNQKGKSGWALGLNKAVYLLMLFSFSVISANSQDVWPTQGWAKTSPGKVNLIADSLAALDRDFASGKYGHVDGMLIIRRGQVAYEKSYSHHYAEIYQGEATKKSGLNPTDPTGPYNYFSSWWHPFYHGSNLHTLQSVTKTVTSMIIGVAITRKEFPFLDTPVLSFFDTSTVKNIDDRKRRMTIRHLLTMTAGFDWHENLPYSDPNNSCSNMEASFDWVKFTIDQPMSDEPGKVFNYNSGATELLAHIFRLATGQDIEEYAVKHLFTPLGIKNHFWKRSPYGLIDTEGGLYLEKSDLAKLFYLFLKNGKWETKQILSTDWISQSVSPYIKFGPKSGYGYKWWLGSYGNKPAEVTWGGNGFGGQFPIIIPEYDMVVVFNAWDIFPSAQTKNYNPDFLVKKVLNTVVEYREKKK